MVSNAPALYLVIVSFFPIKQEIHINSILPASNIKFSLNSFENVSGVIIAPVPNIKNEFKMHEPIKFPIANPFVIFNYCYNCCYHLW